MSTQGQKKVTWDNIEINTFSFYLIPAGATRALLAEMSRALALNSLSKDAVKGLRLNEQKFTESMQDVLGFAFPS